MSNAENLTLVYIELHLSKNVFRLSNPSDSKWHYRLVYFPERRFSNVEKAHIGEKNSICSNVVFSGLVRVRFTASTKPFLNKK